MNETGYEIAALIVKHLKQELTAPEREALEAWLAESPEHRRLLDRLDDEHLLQEDISEIARIDTAGARERLVARLFSQAGAAESEPGPRRFFLRGNRRWYAAAAAVVLLVLCGAAYQWLRPSLQPAPVPALAGEVRPGNSKAVLTLADGSTIALDSAGNRTVQQGGATIYQHSGRLQYNAASAGNAVMNTLTTPRGGQYQVILPDGTVVWLNSASSIKYPTAFKGTERRVTLTGQAYFEVAPNARQPFKVAVQQMEVEALGTAFDIMAYADEKTMNTTLAEGAVRVTAGSEKTILRPGQQALLVHGQQALTIREADVNKVTAWKSGLFVFNNTDIETILREIARWYDVEIINEAGSSNRLYGGSISRRKDLRSVLNLLEAGGACRFSIEGRKVIMLKP